MILTEFLLFVCCRLPCLLIDKGEVICEERWLRARRPPSSGPKERIEPIVVRSVRKKLAFDAPYVGNATAKIEREQMSENK